MFFTQQNVIIYSIFCKNAGMNKIISNNNADEIDWSQLSYEENDDSDEPGTIMKDFIVYKIIKLCRYLAFLGAFKTLTVYIRGTKVSGIKVFGLPSCLHGSISINSVAYISRSV